MLKTFFTRVFDKEEEVDQRYELYAYMRTALYEYTEALHTYNQVRRDFDECSSIVSIALSTLEYHRSRYYNLRLEYEKEYGNEDIYKESVSNVNVWAKKTGISLLLSPTSNSALYSRV